jgi:hypothetical protein
MLVAHRSSILQKLQTAGAVGPPRQRYLLPRFFTSKIWDARPELQAAELRFFQQDLHKNSPIELGLQLSVGGALECSCWGIINPF